MPDSKARVRSAEHRGDLRWPLAHAIARESGCLERHALSRQYFRLSSMVGSAW